MRKGVEGRLLPLDFPYVALFALAAAVICLVLSRRYLNK
jgi:hypothetical protein